MHRCLSRMVKTPLSQRVGVWFLKSKALITETLEDHGRSNVFVNRMRRLGSFHLALFLYPLPATDILASRSDNKVCIDPTLCDVAERPPEY